MTADRTKFERKALDAYRAWYDIDEVPETDGLPLFATARYRSRSEKYVLVKSAKLWAMENNDHVYFFSAESFDGEAAGRCMDYAVSHALGEIKPHSEHMCSFITAVFIMDEAAADALEEIRSRKFYKSFRATLHGWSRLKTVAVELGKEVVVTNREGRDLRKTYLKLCEE